jgi:hypothetical protein
MESARLEDRTGAANQDNDYDFWQDLTFFAYQIDGSSLQRCIEEIRGALERVPRPDPKTDEGFRQNAVLYLMRVIVCAAGGPGIGHLWG